MNTHDYKTMLRAVEQALEVCDRSGFMDETQREICQNLRETRDRLLDLIGTVDAAEAE